MAKKRSKSRSTATKGGVPIKAIVRGMIAVLLVAFIVVAVMDFMAKSAYTRSAAAIGEAIGSEGVTASDMQSLLQGSPELIGDIEKDSSVVYRWGVFRNYDMTLSLEGSPDRVVTGLK